MDKIEKIRQEIERRLNILTNVYAEQVERKDEEMMNYYHGKVIALEELRPFLDTLSEEPDKSLEGAANEFANQDCVTFISRKKGFIAGAEWQKEQLQGEIDFAQQLRKLQESQRKANLEYYTNVRWGEGNLSKESFENAIKGAFEIGVEQQKQQMLKDAVETEVWSYSSDEDLRAIPLFGIDKFNNLKDGDKVRIVVIKEEE